MLRHILTIAFWGALWAAFGDLFSSEGLNLAIHPLLLAAIPAAIGAAGSIGGAAISAQGQSGGDLASVPPGGPSALSDEALRLLDFQTQLGLGQQDVSSISSRSVFDTIFNKAAAGELGTWDNTSSVVLTAFRRSASRLIEQGKREGWSDEETAKRISHRILGSGTTVKVFGTEFDKGEAGFEPQAQVFHDHPRIVQQIISAMGTDFRGLIQLELDQDRQNDELIAATEGVAEEVLAGRLSAMQAVAALQQDFPIATEEAINELSQRLGEEERARITSDVGDLTKSALFQAQAGGFNPAATLGEINKEALLQRGEADTRGLVNALTLLGGKQDLASGGLSALLASLGFPQEEQRQTSATRFTGAPSANTVNAAQVAANANKQVSLGQGIAGGANSLADLVTILGNQPGKGPATGTTAQPGFTDANILPGVSRTA